MIHALGLPTILAALFVAVFLQGDHWTLTTFGLVCVLSIAGYYVFYRMTYRLCCNTDHDEGHHYFYSFVFVSQVLVWWIVISWLLPEV
jgi:uncharacterized membrane-anchored protein